MDDIVTRLRGGSEEKSPAWCWHCEEWGCENADGKSAGCQCEDSCDCANECICECHEWFGVVREAADEIERLQEKNEWLDSHVGALIIGFRENKAEIERLRRENAWYKAVNIQLQDDLQNQHEDKFLGYLREALGSNDDLER